MPPGARGTRPSAAAQGGPATAAAACATVAGGALEREGAKGRAPSVIALAELA